MKKIPTLFVRDMTTRQVTDQVVEGCEWVLAGEGVATRKLDGTCCMVRDGKLYKRYEVKPGGTPPPNFESANEIDENTGKQQGWLPVGDGPEDKWHRQALEHYRPSPHTLLDCWPIDGTYELLGPKVQGNPEHYDTHTLVPHGAELLGGMQRTYADIKEWLSTQDIEGIVFWREQGNPECDKAKIKKRDFGLPRVPK